MLAFAHLSWGQTAHRVDLRDSPSGDTYSRYLGAFGNGRFGVPVCGGHDCDGDGLLDLALSAPSGSPAGRTAAGNVTLLWGREEPFGQTINTERVAEDLLHIAGANALEVCGAEIWMDDVDGDGLGDLLIGRQNFIPTLARRGAGALTIIFGGPILRELSPNGVIDLRDPPENLPHMHVIGGRAYDRLGIWMRTGDLDGDGIADIAVGADEVDKDREANRGEVFLIRGGSHLREVPYVDLVEYPPANLPEHVMRVQPPPLSAGAHFGATVHVGDLDGNGRAEVAIAATLDRSGAGLNLGNAPNGTGAGSGGLGRGMAFVLWDNWFAPERWESGAEVLLSGVDVGVTLVSGGGRNLRFGEELLAGGDFDGDGKGDLFVGDLKGSGVNGAASGLGYVFFDAAQIRSRGLNVDQIPGDVRYTVIQGVAPGALGADAAGYGDLDGDGIDDLVLGNPHQNPLNRISAGSLHVLYGQTAGWPEEINLAANALPEDVRISHVIGARGNTLVDKGDTLGYSLAVVDANGDGVSDIITNEMQGNGARQLDVGNLIVFHGRALFPPINEIPLGSYEWVTAAGVPTLRWEGRWGLRYEVERSTDLLSWERVSAPFEGLGQPLEFQDTDPVGGTNFYRLMSESAD